MRYKLFLILVLASVLGLLHAGRYAGDFMMIGSGVRPLGMGGAFCAIADDGNAIYWNASGISQIRQSEVSVMHAFLYKNLAYYDNITYCQPLPNEVTIGVNLTRLTVDNIPFFDEYYLRFHNVDERINNSDYHLPGTTDTYFKSTDDLFQFAFGKHLHYDLNMGWLFFAVPLDVNLGANIKYIKRQVGDGSLGGDNPTGEVTTYSNTGSGTGFDLSFMAKTDLSVLFDIEGLGKLSFGTNFQDVNGTGISWGNSENLHKDDVLFNTKVGIAVEQPLPSLNSTLTLAYDSDYVYERIDHVGINWNYNKLVDLRAGYYDRNFSVGASLNVVGVNIDYAAITNPLGLTNRVGVRFRF